MKKFGLFIFLALFVTGTFCFAQSVNDSQRIVGSWKYQDTVIYTFNSNGTCRIPFYNSSRDEFSAPRDGRYFISGSKLLIRIGTDYDYIYDCYISPDGKYLAINVNTVGIMWMDKQ